MVKVKEELTVEGIIVELKHKNSSLSIYSTRDDEIIFITNSEGEVITKVEIYPEMSQGQGFVDKLVFVDFQDD